MYYQPIRTARSIALIGSLIAWFGIVLELVLLFENPAVTMPRSLINFFSYFTILTNLLVAVTFTLLAFRIKTFLAHTHVLPATALYIIVVGVVYNLALRGPNTGLQILANEIVHTFIPFLFPMYWIIFVPKYGLRWKQAFLWISYPFLYGVYTIIRGEMTGWYPYPFVNVLKVGYGTALLNFLWICLFFFVMAFALIAVCKRSSKDYNSTL